jgi:hypothetical protein
VETGASGLPYIRRRVTAKDALDRTTRLTRGLLGDAAVRDEVIVSAMTETTVAIVADARNLATQGGQSALVTLAGLTLAFGCQLRLVAPEVALEGPQPPIRGARLRAGLVTLARDLIPGSHATVSDQTESDDLVFVLGDTEWSGKCRGSWRLAAGQWWGGTVPVSEVVQPIRSTFPLGGCVAAAVASIEPYKDAIRRLSLQRGTRIPLPEQIQAVRSARFELAPETAPTDPLDLGDIDMVSAGAINQSALHVLLRMDARARVRSIDADVLSIDNLNRGLLGRRSQIGWNKVDVVAALARPEIDIEGVRLRLTGDTLPSLAPLADTIVVGVDHIPTRWLAQSHARGWMGVGATGDFLALASEHVPGSPCSRCLHPVDDGVEVPIPTLSVVSYWAGLLLAARLWLSRSGLPMNPSRQVLNLVPLRLDLAASVRYQPVPGQVSCGICGGGR